MRHIAQLIRRHASTVAQLMTMAVFSLVMIDLHSITVHAQWTTNGNNINNTNSGSVGIGTTTPGSHKLSVVGNTENTFPNNPVLIKLESTNTLGTNVGPGISFAAMYLDNTPATTFATISGVKENGTAGNWGGRLVFGTRMHGGPLEITRMVIDSTGRVGIGVTNPAYKLDVQGGSINSSGGLCIAGDCKTAWSQLGGGAVSSVFGRTGAVVAAPNDYTWAQINKTTSSLGDLQTRSAGDLNAGTVPIARLGASGIPDATTFLRGDNTWAAVTGGTSQWATTSGTNNISYSSGNVGIGTTTPQRSLDLGTSGQVTFGNNGYSSTGSPGIFWYTDNANYGIYKTAGSWSAPNYQQLKLAWDTGIIIDGGSAYGKSGLVLQPSGGNVGVGTATPNSSYMLDVNGNTNITGNINVTGNINAKYQDVAEWVPASQALPAGTVVTLDPTKSNHVEASSKAYDTRVAGVISAQPGIALGERGENKVLVATTGRVKVKVDASASAIQVGDLLVTSDIEGVAIRSNPVDIGGVQLHRPGTLIGKALEPLAKGRGEILVLLSLQ